MIVVLATILGGLLGGSIVASIWVVFHYKGIKKYTPLLKLKREERTANTFFLLYFISFILFFIVSMTNPHLWTLGIFYICCFSFLTLYVLKVRSNSDKRIKYDELTDCSLTKSLNTVHEN
ncbi:hypothetical protein CN918_28855 [Priestia megaterium]|nr:hypothetical protein CN918_28855 [Priestia megaterium]